LQGRTNVPAEDSAAAHATHEAHLSADALDQIPDLPALNGAGRMKTARAFRANR
jgi:hypothetical protein